MQASTETLKKLPADRAGLGLDELCRADDARANVLEFLAQLSSGRGKIF